MRLFILAAMLSMVMATGSVFAAEEVNINTATAEQLQSVKGIGEKTAAAIIIYREAHGAFKSVDDLTRVKGIGDKKLDKIDDDLTVE
ncbi:MAG: ComEA family DNA-binding protein [Mariprofundus sp.]|nr:ComEA family DNA-binding protein [Mariprofundus sp.]